MQKKVVLGLLVICLAAGCGSSDIRMDYAPQIENAIDTTFFFDPGLFDRVWFQSTTTKAIPGVPKVLLVNHHNLASDLMFLGLRSVAQARSSVRTNRIVIISPDHFGSGRSRTSTHFRHYRTTAGTVSIDTTATRSLVETRLAGEESGQMFEVEHGIGVLLPAIAKLFPDAQLVPIAVKSSASREEVDALSLWLTRIDDVETLVIVSSDMSHYLPELEAKRNDAETLAWIESGSISKFREATDAFLDNGKGFASVLGFLQTAHPRAVFEKIGMGISSDYGGDPKNTTTYLIGVWYEKIPSEFDGIRNLRR